MDADLLFLIFYWCVCIFAVAVFLFTGVDLLSMLACGVAVGFAVAMSTVFVQERMEMRRYHYR